MGLLDPDGVRRRRARARRRGGAARVRGARHAALASTSASRFAFRIAAANVAEEVANVAIRHGVDPRDFTVVAYGAAGPMLLPATLDLLQVARIVVPPHPGLFSALGLLSTDLVFYDSRSAYILLTPDAAPEIDRHFSEMEEQAARARRRGGRGPRAASTGGCSARAGRRRSSSSPTGRSPPTTIGELLARFHAAYEQRYGNRFEMVPVQGVTYRVQLIVEAEQVRYDPLPERRRRRRRAARSSCATSPADPCDAEEFERDQLPVGARVRGPAVIREPTVDDVRLPGAVRRGRPLRRDRHRTGGRA